MRLLSEGRQALLMLKGCISNERLKNGGILLVGMLLQSQSISAHVEVPPNAFQGAVRDVSISPSPLWTNVNDIQLDLYFDSGEACCTAIMGAHYEDTASFKLERKTASGWSFEKSWNQSSSTNSLSLFNTDAVSSGYTYRF
ncbi:MAG: hypothetical protein E6600_04095 [Anaerocolumna aminovalerica]|jgi:hypothetical protein|uniref:hypothetical protein n=1 Tax=Anaerocolumna aminovalerica TaxID=1527 RepID=UPI00290FCB0E|nr:hypothetical protein [Anaerocolumna aminovalerica]MDU6263669.1 hypothetical protein [Anaerocolumna aminovalerica]